MKVIIPFSVRLFLTHSLALSEEGLCLLSMGSLCLIVYKHINEWLNTTALAGLLVIKIWMYLKLRHPDWKGFISNSDYWLVLLYSHTWYIMKQNRVILSALFCAECSVNCKNYNLRPKCLFPNLDSSWNQWYFWFNSVICLF